MHCCDDCAKAALKSDGLGGGFPLGGRGNKKRRGTLLGRSATNRTPRKQLFKGVFSCPSGYREVSRTAAPRGKSNILCQQVPARAAPPPRPRPRPRPAPRINTRVIVSPTFQQSFTPQFSPTMQQTQDSPGSVQSATPTQVATPSQAANTGITAEEVAALIAASIPTVIAPPPTVIAPPPLEPQSTPAPLPVEMGPPMPYITGNSYADQTPQALPASDTGGLSADPWLLAVGAGIIAVGAFIVAKK